MLATKRVLFLAPVRRLPRNLCLTLQRCYACHETCAFPCASAAPATKSMPDLAEDAMLATKRVLFLAQVLRLPRNLCLTLRRCYACHETCAFPCASAAPLTLRRCYACHETCAVPCASAAPATKSMPDLAKNLCLPRNVCFTLRKCCTCREIYA